MSKDDILRGISCYGREQQILVRVIRRHSELTDSDFDRLFGGYKYRRTQTGHTVASRRKPKLRFMFIASNGFILGDMFGGERSKWIHLAQLMCAAGILETESRGDNVVYSIRYS